MNLMRRPTIEELDAASDMLVAVAREHGLTDVRHGREPGQLVVGAEPGRGYFDVVRFAAEVEGQLGFRPEVLAASAPAVEPGRPIGRPDTHAA